MTLEHAIETGVKVEAKTEVQPEPGMWLRFEQRISRLLDDGKKKKPIAVLDGVRAIACLAIVVFHQHVTARDGGFWVPIHEWGSLTGALLLAGQCGVQLFFVLSGLLLFLPYAKWLLFEGRRPSARLFYLRRIFRIVPAYYIALFLMILLFHPEYTHIDHLSKLWLFLTFRMDFPQTYQQINGPFWTLAVEFQFYICLPVLAFFMSLIVRHGSLHNRVIKLTMCIIVISAWGLATLYWGNHNEALQWLLPASISNNVRPYIYGQSGKSLEVFAMGMLVALAYIYSQNTPLESCWNKAVRLMSPWFFFTGLALLSWMTIWHFYIWYYNWTFHFLDPYRTLLISSWDQWQSFLYALSFALCIFALLHGPTWLKRPFEFAPLRWLGLISYSLYMWHVPLMMVFVDHILQPIQVTWWRTTSHHLWAYLLFWSWTLLIIIPFSLCLYVLVEKPGMWCGEQLRSYLAGWKQKQLAKPEISNTEPAPLSQETALSASER